LHFFPHRASPVTDETTRRALRAHMRSRRAELGAAIRLAAADGVADRLRQLPELQRPGFVAGYWAVSGEVPLHALLAPAPNFTYCLPVLGEERALKFSPWKFGDEVRPNAFGIPEPADAERLEPTALDVVLLPLVAFDRRGARLGSGAGYYDRSFQFLRERVRPSKPLLVGVAYGFQEVGELHEQPWDVPLDLVATEGELIRPSR
jgi:5-formyltetrahydrofolate cyclo-ligase